MNLKILEKMLRMKKSIKLIKLIIEILMFVLFLLGITGYLIIKSNYQDNGMSSSKPKYIIILGAEIEGKPKRTIPGVILRDRLNVALKYRMKYPKAKIILSGLGKEAERRGLGSESETMEKYLISNGVPKNKLIIENKSQNTLQNLDYSKKKISPQNSRVTIITSDFHMARALTLAKKLKINAVGYSAHTTEISTEYNLFREIVAFWISLFFSW